MKIPCKGGLLYLVRLRIINTPWFGIYLHDIHEPDADRDPHNHPWSFFSIVLRGHYIERLYKDPSGEPYKWKAQRWDRFSIHRMDQTSAHRIIEAGDGLKTLILVGPRQSGWGFFLGDGSYVPWQEYERTEQGE
jgi:hypothetical protein